MEAHKQFMKLVNEGYISTSLTEAGEDEAPQPDGEQEPPMGGDQHMQPPMDGGMTPSNDGQPPMDNAQEPPMGDGTSDMGADMPPADGGMPPIGDTADSEPQEKDEVIDVDDLTKAQEKLNTKQNMVGKDLGQLDSRIEKLMAAVEAMKGIIDHNNNEITDLKAELQKRVPTQ